MSKLRVLLLLFTVTLIVAGCGETSSTSTAQAQSAASCPIIVPPVRAVQQNSVLCPTQVIDASHTNDGYSEALYIVTQGGSISIETKGGSDRLVLVSVQYQEVLDNGANRTAVVFFAPATSYTIDATTCSGPAGKRVHAQPLLVTTYVPTSAVLSASRVADGESVGNGGVLGALDPSFGLTSYPKLDDALCAS